ncbi:hypothetical protein GC197_07540 [bacterium]|nr:hypothetical protein [bacterium]
MNLTTVSKPILSLLILLFPLVALSAAEPDQADATQSQVIRKLIRELDADQFAVRQNAANELAKIGKETIPAIEKAALAGTGEVVSRSVDLLKLFAGSPEQETARLALSSLRNLAASGNQTASYLAEEAIEQLKRRVGPNRILDDLQPVAEGMPAGHVEQSVQISNVNGNRTIDVTQNGERVVAQTGADGHVSVTWHLPGGKERTVEADSADKLQKQDPEAFAKLTELNKIADAGPFRFPGQADGPRVHVRVPRPIGPRFDPFSNVQQQVEAMRARHERFLSKMEESLNRRIAPGDALPPKPAADGKKLEEVRLRMGEMIERLKAAQPNDIDSVDLQRLEDALQQIETKLQKS